MARGDYASVGWVGGALGVASGVAQLGGLAAFTAGIVVALRPPSTERASHCRVTLAPGAGGVATGVTVSVLDF
jgi:hypothetical protein